MPNPKLSLLLITIQSCVIGAGSYVLDGGSLGPFLWWGMACSFLGVAVGTTLRRSPEALESDPTGSKPSDPLTGINVR